jgi:diguanylate cyclase
MPDILSQYRGADGVRLARKTLDLLGQNQIPTSPANYETWVAYASGAYPDLSRDIDAQLQCGAPFTDSFNAALFERFFADTSLTVDMVETSESLARELSNVMAALRDASAQADGCAETLQHDVDAIDAGARGQVLMSAVSRIAAATRDMAAQNRRLSQQMDASSRQVETLQSTLQSVRVAALTDSLTGLANRRLFDETLRRQLAQAEADGVPLCLVMCDIDHFKHFNDTWGHIVGDQVIRFIASALRHFAQGDLLAARYGGEEFAIILPRCSLVQAHAIASDIYSSVRSKRLTRRSTGDVLGAVTISIGIAEQRSGDLPTDLIARADACLYASKRNGRDRITTESDLDMPEAA